MTGLFWIFAIFDAGALLMLAAELTSSRGLLGALPWSVRSPAVVLALLASYIVQLALTAYGAFHQAQALPHVFLPVPLTSAIVAHKDMVTAGVIITSAIQSYLLLLLYRGRVATPWIVAGSVALVVLSLISPVMMSDDAYANAGDALLGLRAYAPPPVSFHGEYAAINVWWPPPLKPMPYGPLWLLAAWLVTAPFGSLLAKIVALRLLGVASFAALLYVLRHMQVPCRVLAVAALNCGLLFEYVVSGHNDLFGIAFVCAAALAVRRPAVAAALVLAGALVKLPFALFGLPVMVGFRSNATRVGAIAGVAAAAAALTFAVGGAGYARALAIHATTTPLMSVLSGAVAVAVIVATIAAVFRTKRLRSVVWLTPLASSYTLSSYAVWGLPYALTRRNVLGYLLVAFPLATTLIEVKFMTAWSLFAVVPIVFAWQVLAVRKR